MKKHRLFITLLLTTLAAQATLADDIKVIGQNLQNFFYSLDRGRTQGNSVTMSNYTTEAGRTKKLNAICNTLSQYHADIYTFNEVECCEEVMELLAQRMSQYTDGTYLHVTDGLTYDKTTSADGNIKSGFIYNAATIEPVGSNLSAAIGYTYVYPQTMRLQTFKSKSSGEAFTLSMNHFKASTSADADYDLTQREGNSIALLKGLDQSVWDPDILVMGDLNSEMGEQCLNNLVDAGYEEQILLHEGSTAASHWYYSSGSLIDHAFANGTMAAQISDARVLYVANPHSTGNKNTAYSDHDPYLVTLHLEAQPEATFGYKRVTSMQAGMPYLMVVSLNGQLNAAKPVPTDKTYAYQLTTVVTETDGYITLPDAKSAFRFEEDGNGTYYIKDYYGRYVYQYKAEGKTYYNNSTNVGNRSAAHTFSVTPQADGTFKIQNTVSDCYYQGLIYNNAGEFALYDQPRDNRYLPWLYEYDANAPVTAITEVTLYNQPTTTRKVVQNGRLTIVTSEGLHYNLQGMEMKQK